MLSPNISTLKPNRDIRPLRETIGPLTKTIRAATEPAPSIQEERCLDRLAADLPAVEVVVEARGVLGVSKKQYIDCLCCHTMREPDRLLSVHVYIHI